MKSPASTPALAAGVSSIGVMTLTRSFSIVTSMPRPPNSPLVWTRMSLAASGVHVGRMRIERGQHAVDGALDQRLLVRRRHILGAHALEDVAENRELPVGVRTCRICRRAGRAIDQAHGGRAHQRAGKQKRQFTYHFLSFQKDAPPTRGRIDGFSILAELYIELRNMFPLRGAEVLATLASPIAPTGSPARTDWPSATLILLMPARTT